MLRALSLCALILFTFTSCSWYSNHISGPDMMHLVRGKLLVHQKVFHPQVVKGESKKAQTPERKKLSSNRSRSRFLRWYTKYISGPDTRLLVRRKILANRKVAQVQRKKLETRKAQAPERKKLLPPGQALVPLQKAPMRYSPPLGVQVARAKEKPEAPILKKAPPRKLNRRLDALWDRFDRSCQLWRCPIGSKAVIELDRSFKELIREARRSPGPGALSMARQAWVDFRLALGDMRIVQERYLSAATNYCYALGFARARGMEEGALAKEKFLKAYREAKGRYRPPKLKHLSGCLRVS